MSCVVCEEELAEIRALNEEEKSLANGPVRNSIITKNQSFIYFAVS